MPKVVRRPLAWLLALLAAFLVIGEPAVAFADEKADTVSLASPDPPSSVEHTRSLYPFRPQRWKGTWLARWT